MNKINERLVFLCDKCVYNHKNFFCERMKDDRYNLTVTECTYYKEVDNEV